MATIHYQEPDTAPPPRLHFKNYQNRKIIVPKTRDVHKIRKHSSKL